MHRTYCKVTVKDPEESNLVDLDQMQIIMVAHTRRLYTVI